jgi:hypothetical protein
MIPFLSHCAFSLDNKAAYCILAQSTLEAKRKFGGASRLAG